MPGQCKNLEMDNRPKSPREEIKSPTLDQIKQINNHLPENNLVIFRKNCFEIKSYAPKIDQNTIGMIFEVMEFGLFRTRHRKRRQK